MIINVNGEGSSTAMVEDIMLGRWHKGIGQTSISKLHNPVIGAAFRRSCF